MQLLILALTVLTYLSTQIELPYEINIISFSVAIIYIGSIRSLEQYSLKKEDANAHK